MLKNTDSGKQGEAQIRDIIGDYLAERLGDNGGLIDEYERLKFNKECFYYDVPPPRKRLIDGIIVKDGYWQIESSTGHSLLIVNENKHKSSTKDSGSILQSYETELDNLLPTVLEHFRNQNRWTVVVGLFTMTGLPRLKNWNWRDDLWEHLYQHKIWFSRQPGKTNIHTELDDIFEYYATEIDWENRQTLPTHLKEHLGIR